MQASPNWSLAPTSRDPSTGVGDVTIHAAGGGGGGGAVDSVNGQTGVVILTAADVGAVAPGDDVMT